MMTGLKRSDFRGCSVALIVGAAVSVWQMLAPPASATEIGVSEFVYSSDLLAQGFEPIAVSSTAGAVYGLRKGQELYLCVIADTDASGRQRTRVLKQVIDGSVEDRTLPNIPIACILTQ